jgi:hypothetical protein
MIGHDCDMTDHKEIRPFRLYVNQFPERPHCKFGFHEWVMAGSVPWGRPRGDPIQAEGAPAR